MARRIQEDYFLPEVSTSGPDINVIPASPAVILDSRMASSSEVFPWSTCGTVTTGCTGKIRFARLIAAQQFLLYGIIDEPHQVRILSHKLNGFGVQSLVDVGLLARSGLVISFFGVTSGEATSQQWCAFNLTNRRFFTRTTAPGAPGLRRRHLQRASLPVWLLRGAASPFFSPGGRRCFFLLSSFIAFARVRIDDTLGLLHQRAL